MATTYNWTDASISGTLKPHDTTPRGYEPFILRNHIDTTLQTVTGDASVIQAINVRAGTIVLGAWVVVTTVEGTGATDCDLGYGGDPNQWADVLDLNAAEGYVEDALSFGAPIYFAADDTIDLVNQTGNDLDSAIFEVAALCIHTGTVGTIDAGGSSYAAQS